MNRIPCEEVKKLAFGTVPNIFEDEAYLLRERDAQSLEVYEGPQTYLFW